MRSAADDVWMTYVPADDVRMMYTPADNVQMMYPPVDDIPDDICHLRVDDVPTCRRCSRQHMSSMCG